MLDEKKLTFGGKKLLLDGKKLISDEKELLDGGKKPILDEKKLLLGANLAGPGAQGARKPTRPSLVGGCSVDLRLGPH